MIALSRVLGPFALLAAAWLAACASTPPPAPEAAPTSPSDRVQTVRDLYDWLNHGRIEDATTLLDDDVKLFDIGGLEHSGKGGARDSFKLAADVFPGNQRVAVRTIESDIAVITEYVLAGAHTGLPFMELPALGKPVGVHGLTIVGFIDQRIGAIKRYQDTLSVLDQIKDGSTARPASAPTSAEALVLPDTASAMQAQSDTLKAWLAKLPTETCEASLCTPATVHHLMVDGAAALDARPFGQVLAELRASSPGFSVDNTWVYPAKGFAVVTLDLQQVKANPALRLTAERNGALQLAMVLRFDGASVAEVWTYLNRELPSPN